MRKQWFGDSRDYVKWSCVLAEAGDHFAVVYAPMLRADDYSGENLSAVVKGFFDKHKDFAVLGELFKGGFTYLPDIYEKSRSDEYFDQLYTMITAARHNKQVVIFVDPDTGIEPKGQVRDEHIRKRNLKGICDKLHDGEKVIVYQHSSREKGWIDKRLSELKPLAEETGTTVKSYFETGTAKDVCFFVFTKSNQP